MFLEVIIILCIVFCYKSFIFVFIVDEEKFLYEEVVFGFLKVKVFKNVVRWIEKDFEGIFK